MKNSHPSQTGLPRDRFPQKLQLGYRLNNIYLKINKQTKKDVDYWLDNGGEKSQIKNTMKTLWPFAEMKNIPFTSFSFY